MSNEGQGGAQHGPREFIFFVDDKKYDTTSPVLRGDQITAMVPGWDPSWALELEGHGNEPDEIIRPDQVVQLNPEHGGPKHFFHVPSANFGDAGAGAVERQMVDVTRRFPGSTASRLGSGTTLVRIPDVALLGGWNREHTLVHFLLLANFPFATPDCFWADGDLRLASGAMPQSAQIQAIPETPDHGLWFSWHLSAWNPSRDTIMNWVETILGRLRPAR